MMWIMYDRDLWASQKLPREGRFVLVQFEKTDSFPCCVGVGYLRFAAGDKNSPHFITPGLALAEKRKIVAWCDCLGDDFCYGLGGVGQNGESK